MWHNDDDGFYLDAQSCRTSAAFKTKVRMNAGGMSELDLDAGYDEKAYRICMTEHGWEAKVVDETRSAVDECRNHALRLGVATPAESDPRLIRYLDTETFDECLLEHGVEGIVRVKPLRPAQPTSGSDR
ncbi:hypothetical protein [Methylococcus sp. EFPC2]|uniref:hypothetical protein n=1 Tax=Methylococcus sp. EFPC2 TaxID=2812648 RepID=UPI001968271B|nr:hypothetical protein [Methylococcus sp. EFPC2]QSA96619.1 hypothetical protein JWZ97_15565 [Methylococcus sp. EFPC2]